MINEDANLQQLTVIKVPASVSKRWYEKTQEAIRTGSSIRIGSVSRAKRQLELSDGVSNGVEFPKHYTLKEEAHRNAVPTLLFATYEQGISLEGRLDQVTAHVDTLSNAYQASTASVNKEATAEKFFTHRDKSVIQQRQSALNARDQVTRVSKIAKMSKDQFEKERDVIEGQLFELFKEKPAWKTADVANALRINNSQATGLLAPIAAKVQSGPCRGEWTLKPEYREQEALATEGDVDAPTRDVN